jgi:hypothetical protein
MSSFEDIAVYKQSDDDWQLIDKSPNCKPESSSFVSENQLQTENISGVTSILDSSTVNQNWKKMSRRRSESSIIGLMVQNNRNVDASLLIANVGNDRDVKNLKISCRKCGKTKSKIKEEIIKLSEQLKSSNQSDEQIKTKIDEFMDYLETKSQTSEMTETEESQQNNNDTNFDVAFVPHSASHDEIEGNIFDENEGINVYATQSVLNEPSCSKNVSKRFISLDDINSRYFLLKFSKYLILVVHF